MSLGVMRCQLTFHSIQHKARPNPNSDGLADQRTEDCCPYRGGVCPHRPTRTVVTLLPVEECVTALGISRGGNSEVLESAGVKLGGERWPLEHEPKGSRQRPSAVSSLRLTSWSAHSQTGDLGAGFQASVMTGPVPSGGSCYLRELVPALDTPQ